MIISTDAEKLLGKIKYLLLVKYLTEPGTEGKFLKLIKDIHVKFTICFSLNGKRLLSASVFNIILTFVASNEQLKVKVKITTTYKIASEYVKHVRINMNT